MSLSAILRARLFPVKILFPDEVDKRLLFPAEKMVLDSFAGDRDRFARQLRRRFAGTTGTKICFGPLQRSAAPL